MDEDMEDEVFTEVNSQNANRELFNRMIITFNPTFPLPTQFREPVDLIGITLTSIQELCIKLSLHHPKLFLNPGIGIGKTTILYSFSIALAYDRREPIIILNTDSNLLYRDYNKVRQLLDSMSLSRGNYLKSELLNADSEEELEITELITFMTPPTFKKVKLPEYYHLLIDEFHNLFFTDLILETAPLIESAQTMLALSGSPLDRFKADLLEETIGQSCVVLFRDSNILNYRERDLFVEKSVFKQLRQVAKIAKVEKAHAPVLIIIDEAVGE